MSRALYLKIVGIVELIISIIGIIFLLIYVIGITAEASWAVANFGPDGVTGFWIAMIWILFFIYAFFAPSIGVLFLTVAKHEEGGSTVVHTKTTVPPSYSNKMSALDNRIYSLERKIALMQQSSQTAETQKPNDPLENFSKKDKERLKKEMLEGMIEKTNKSSEIDTTSIARGKDKDEYALEDRIAFNQNFTVNNIEIKKGDTGIIDNRLLTTGGRIYVVILDKTKESVKVSGVYFE